jgi:hypothetical protein
MNNTQYYNSCVSEQLSNMSEDCCQLYASNILTPSVFYEGSQRNVIMREISRALNMSKFWSTQTTRCYKVLYIYCQI